MDGHHHGYLDEDENDPGFVPTTVISYPSCYFETLIWRNSTITQKRNIPSFNIIIVPGNPGHPSFYQNYIECLVPKLPSVGVFNWRISVVGLKGHVSYQCRSQASWLEYIKGSSIHYNLDQQIDHVSEYVKNESTRYGEGEASDTAHAEKTIIIGHSIGCYIGMEAMRRNPDNIHAFLAIMPFLERNLESSDYLQLRFIMRYFWPVLFVLALIAEAASYLPVRLQHMLLNGKMKNMDAKVRDFTVSSMLAFGVICNYLYLGKTEFDNHETLYNFDNRLSATSPNEGAEMKQISLKDRVHLFYTDNDFWAPLHVEAKARQNFNMKTTVLKGIPHAFGVSTESSEMVAEWTVGYLKGVVKEPLQKKI